MHDVVPRGIEETLRGKENRRLGFAPPMARDVDRQRQYLRGEESEAGNPRDRAETGGEDQAGGNDAGPHREVHPARPRVLRPVDRPSVEDSILPDENVGLHPDRDGDAEEERDVASAQAPRTDGERGDESSEQEGGGKQEKRQEPRRGGEKLGRIAQVERRR